MSNPPTLDLWKKYAVYDETQIKGFFGEFRFLSNFHVCDIWMGGRLYPSSEHAYMAAKTRDTDTKNKFTKSGGLTCAQARKFGQTVELRADWDSIKYDVMLGCVFQKFWANRELAARLLETNSRYLEETNHWNDTFWGFSWQKQAGENNLGKILMKVRECLRR